LVVDLIFEGELRSFVALFSEERIVSVQESEFLVFWGRVWFQAILNKITIQQFKRYHSNNEK
jgi:hypothetical protein